MATTAEHWHQNMAALLRRLPSFARLSAADKVAALKNVEWMAQVMGDAIVHKKNLAYTHQNIVTSFRANPFWTGKFSEPDLAALQYGMAGGFADANAAVDSGGALDWLSNAASSAGRTFSDGVSGVGDLVGSVPIIGKPLRSAFNLATGPYQLAERIASGERIDRAVVNHVKDQVSAVRDVAPYAKMIVTEIPGIGSGIGAAYEMGNALADGKPIDQVLVAGARGALPASARMAMDVTMAAAKGENLGKVGLNVACDQLPPNARTAVDLVGRAARGERIDKVALEGARGALPADVRQGIDVGVALGHGANVQATVASQIEKAPMGALADAMKGAVAESLANPVFQAGASLLTDEQRKGYNVGLGLLNHSGVNETVIRLVRAKLAPEQKIGFDIAASTRVGMIRGGAPKGTPTSVSAFLATKGMVGGSPKQKAAMMSQLAKNKEARSAAALAIRDVEAAKARAKAAPVVLSLYGAATSAGTGFMAGGPIGAAVGAIVGGGLGWLSGRKVAA